MSNDLDDLLTGASLLGTDGLIYDGLGHQLGWLDEQGHVHNLLGQDVGIWNNPELPHLSGTLGADGLLYDELGQPLGWLDEQGQVHNLLGQDVGVWDNPETPHLNGASNLGYDDDQTTMAESLHASPHSITLQSSKSVYEGAKHVTITDTGRIDVKNPDGTDSNYYAGSVDSRKFYQGRGSRYLGKLGLDGNVYDDDDHVSGYVHGGTLYSVTGEKLATADSDIEAAAHMIYVIQRGLK